jgi:(5-formylfuran-3-yl)methyl phosphate synthase
VRLLVSVANAAEASAALAGGADFIDAKDPATGALGAVLPQVFLDIHACVSGERPVTAALGDAADEEDIERTARAFAAAGARLVKVGFAGIASAERAGALTAAAVRGAGSGRHGRCGVVAVAYADADRAGSIAPDALVEVAARAGAEGMLLDTAYKNGPGLRDLVASEELGVLVTRLHERGLFVALAGRLTAGDLPFLRDTRADVAGVRGAACDAGRTGHVSADRVRLLQQSGASIRKEQR